MDENYFSIESIVAENQKIQCTMLIDIPGLGYLDNNVEDDIKKDTKLQLPFWLAPPLLYGDWSDFIVPPPFNSKVRNALDAEARSVRLSGLVGVGGMWYGFGRMIVQLSEEKQAKELSDILLKTFKNRLVDLMDQAQHISGSSGGSAAASITGDPSAEFREGLEATERELFVLAQESSRQTKAWYESSDLIR